jgi:hypothetical protein
MVDPGIVPEKLVVAFRDPDAIHPRQFESAEPAAPPGYLGPPESYYSLSAVAPKQ